MLELHADGMTKAASGPRQKDRNSTSTRSVDLDAERLFAADLSSTRVLQRDEEEELAGAVCVAREHLRSLLLAAPALIDAALAPFGHRVVRPEEDFREREAVLVVQFARDQHKRPKPAADLGWRKADLRHWLAKAEPALTQYRAVRDRMVQSNIRLVNALARRYKGGALPHLDLVQEGVLGLMRAVEKYEPSRNVRFSTYATWWIWQALGRSADTHGSLVRTPVHWGQLRRKVGRGDASFVDEGGAPMSRSDMAAAQGLASERFDTMTRAFTFLSTSAPLREDDDRPLESQLAAEGNDPQVEAEQASLRHLLERALCDLPERESLILRRRFGLVSTDTCSLEQLGQELGVSRERVRQLEARALHKLKEGAAGSALADYLH